MKRIYIKAFTQKNLGDDLFVLLLCRRYPKIRFFISCPVGMETAFENVKNLTIMNRQHFRGMLLQNLKRILKKVRPDADFPYDAQVYIGGSIFIEPSGWNEAHGYEQLLYQYKMSRNLPFFILGANFGPYSSEKFLNLHKNYFKKEVQDLCFRDRQSYQLFSELENVRFAPDILCTLRMPEREKEPLILISCIYQNGVEGVENFDNERYQKKMAEICRRYAKSGKKVGLLSFCGSQKDMIMCRKIEAEVGLPQVFTKEYLGDPEEILELFSKAEYVISARFHGMILAWAAGVPVFPISYNNKTRQVIEDYGFAGRYCSIREFPEIDFETVNENFSAGYVLDMSRIRTEAQKQFLALDDFLKENESD